MSVRNIVAVIFFCVVAVFFIFSAFMMHPFGSPDESDMDDYIVENCQEETLLIMVLHQSYLTIEVLIHLARRLFYLLLLQV